MALNVPDGLANLQHDLVSQLTTKNIDLKMRKCVNAAPGTDNNDYVIVQQLNNIITELQREVTLLQQQVAAGEVNSISWVQATANLTLTTLGANVPGLSISLNRTGVWLLLLTLGVQEGNAGNADSGFDVIGNQVVNGVGVGPPAFFQFSNGTSSNTGGGTVATQTVYRANTQPLSYVINAYKTGGTGNSIVSTQSSISALWISS